MNLDLNLGPLNNPSDGDESRPESYSNVPVNLEDWLTIPAGVAPVIRPRTQRWRSLWRPIPISHEARNLALELFAGNVPMIGQSIAAAEARPSHLGKTCENGACNAEDDTRGKKEDGKNSGDEGSFFDCNICLDLAKDPVVTICGHLFCWSCLYQWIHNYSEAKECPICKGEVSLRHVTPIYGRGSNIREPGVRSSLKIPLRPQAQRSESWRQTVQRAAFPVEETSMQSTQLQPRNRDPDEPPYWSDSLLDLLWTSRSSSREYTVAVPPVYTPAAPSDNVFVSAENGPPNFDSTEYNPTFSAPRVHRPHPYRASTLSNAASLMSSAENLAADRLIELYYHSISAERNQGRLPPFEDRDSVSSIAAAIHSESQTVDNGTEIDSTVSFSIASSRRMLEASRQPRPDGDNGDAPAPRRRRLN